MAAVVVIILLELLVQQIRDMLVEINTAHMTHTVVVEVQELLETPPPVRQVELAVPEYHLLLQILQ